MFLNILYASKKSFLTSIGVAKNWIASNFKFVQLQAPTFRGNPWPCMALFWYFYPLDTFEILLFLHSFQLDNSFKSCLQGVLKMVIFFFPSQPLPNKVNGSKFFIPHSFLLTTGTKKILTACSIPRFSILPLSAEETSFPNDKSLLEVCATPILIMGSVMGLSKWLLQSKSRRPMGKNHDYHNGVCTYFQARCWNVCATPIFVMGSVMGLSKWLLQSKPRRPMGKKSWLSQWDLYIPSGSLLECALGVELLRVADELGTFATTPLNWLARKAGVTPILKW